MNGSGKTAYRLTEYGQVVVVDRRHLTNGAIVPNYVVDLYLPIIGYVGLGVLTMLYRFVNRGKHQLRLDLHKHAKVGRVGFRTLEHSLICSRNADSVVAYLHSKGVVAAQEFKHLDFEAVRARVEFLERDPNLLPRGIVKSLRASPPVPVARDRYGAPIAGPIDASRYVNGEYGDLFRLGSDVSGLDDPSTALGPDEEATQ
jgi:hypothetical protein